MFLFKVKLTKQCDTVSPKVNGDFEYQKDLPTDYNVLVYKFDYYCTGSCTITSGTLRKTWESDNEGYKNIGYYSGKHLNVRGSGSLMGSKYVNFIMSTERRQSCFSDDADPSLVQTVDSDIVIALWRPNTNFIADYSFSVSTPSLASTDVVPWDAQYTLAARALTIKQIENSAWNLLGTSCKSRNDNMYAVTTSIPAGNNYELDTAVSN